MPVVHYVWDLRGTPQQNRIIEDTLERVDFPWHWLRDELVSEVGRTSIPVEWADLSRYAEDAEGPDEEQDESHKSEDKIYSRKPRHHGGDDEFHIVGYRNRVLGLAWYSGKVTMEASLVNEPELAGEVFMSEGAHMVDFFYMNDEHRAGVWNAFHPDSEDVPLDTIIEDGVPLGHNHGWFDVGGYYSWVGEAFMGGFVKAFSDLPVTIDFDHAATSEAAAEIRRVFGLGEPEEPAPEIPTEEPQAPDAPVAPEEPVNEEPVAPEPEPTPPEDEEPEGDDPVVPPEEEAPFYALDDSGVFHDSHKRIAREVVFNSYEAAVNSGRRPCKVCKPRQSVV